MRQLKFRVFKGDVFHYWGFIDDPDGMVFASPPLSGQIRDIQERSEQFTGLLDKNGVEIYESDIVEWPKRAFREGESKAHRAEISWIEKRAGFLVYTLPENMEVIGNVHQDSHLLTNQN